MRKKLELLAIVAATAQQNLGNFANFLARSKTACRQLDFIHARYRSTVDADKMRVSRTVTLVFRDQLEPPDAVSQFLPLIHI